VLGKFNLFYEVVRLYLRHFFVFVLIFRVLDFRFLWLDPLRRACGDQRLLVSSISNEKLEHSNERNYQLSWVYRPGFYIPFTEVAVGRKWLSDLHYLHTYICYYNTRRVDALIRLHICNFEWLIR
jgi:hypothetical protein